VIETYQEARAVQRRKHGDVSLPPCPSSPEEPQLLPCLFLRLFGRLDLDKLPECLSDRSMHVLPLPFIKVGVA